MTRFVISVFIAFACAACSNEAPAKSPADNRTGDSSVTVIDSAAQQQEIYSQAIAEYIKAVYQKDQTVFDTLFFGRHNDFPNITLPPVIQHTKIVLVNPAEAGDRLGSSKSSAFINLVGTVTKDSATFVFVTFAAGFRHDYDCFIDLDYEAAQEKYAPVKLRFENYIYNKEGKLERIIVYRDGKYAGEKPVE